MAVLNDDGTYTITVNGVDRNVSPDDLITLAQKGESADERFQQAAAIKKELDEFVKTKAEDLELAANMRKAFQTNDQQALAAAVAKMGISGEEFAKYVAPTPQPKADDGLSADDKARLKWFEEFTDAARANGLDPKQYVAGIVGDRKARGKQAVVDRFQELFAKEPEFATMFKKGDSRSADVLKLGQAILSHKFVEGETQNLNDEAISASARDAMDTLKRLLGSSGDSSGGISLGGTPSPSVMGFTGKPVKPIERPTVNDDSSKRDTYLEQRLAQMMQEAAHPES